MLCLTIAPLTTSLTAVKTHLQSHGLCLGGRTRRLSNSRIMEPYKCFWKDKLAWGTSRVPWSLKGNLLKQGLMGEVWEELIQVDLQAGGTVFRDHSLWKLQVSVLLSGSLRLGAGKSGRHRPRCKLPALEYRTAFYTSFTFECWQTYL